MSSEPPASDSRKGKHTLAGDGEAPIDNSAPQLQKFSMTWAVAEGGEKVLVMRFLIGEDPENGDHYMFFMMKGDELFKFFDFVKTGMEGGKKRPSYLG